MDRRLKQLIQERQRERCPEAVMDRVRQEIAPGQASLIAATVLSWFVATACLIGLLYVQRDAWAPRQEGPSEPLSSVATQDRQVREVTYASLAYIGKTLINAGRKSGQIIVQETLPPLQSGFENTRKAISNDL